MIQLPTQTLTDKRKNDPRYRMAEILMQTPQNIRSPLEGLGQLAKVAAGTYKQKQVDREYDQKEQVTNDTLAGAMSAYDRSQQGGETQLKNGEKITWNKSTPEDADNMLISALSKNSETSPMALQMQMDQVKNRQSLAAELSKEQRERGYKAEDFEKEAALKRELSTMKAGSTVVVDPETGQMTVQPTGPRKLSATEQKEFFEAQDQLNSARESQNILKQVGDIREKPMFTGAAAPYLAAANRVPLVGSLINDEKAANTTTYDNLLKEQAYARLKQVFSGGNITEGERASLERLQALSSYTPQEQEQILAEADVILKRAEQRAAAKAQGITTGDIYANPTQSPNLGNVGAQGGNVGQETPRQKLERLRAQKAGR